jgi:membrane protease subunit HflK
MSWDWEKLQKQRQGPSGQGGGVPPEIDELLKKLKEFKFSGGPVIAVVIIIFLALMYSVFFTIKTGEEGVIQRFGKFIRIAEPGPNFKLPFGIEKVTKVNREVLRTEEFDPNVDIREGRARFASEAETGNVSLMLTGDLNVALVPWVVQYKIKESDKWLFKVDDVIGLLRDMSETSMRLVIGDRSVTEVIKREGIEQEMKRILQKELDESETGIRIEAVKLNTTNVPRPVQSSFNEVNQAVQEKEKMIYQAREAYNKEIPKARGEAERTIKAAEGYATERVNKAKGDASRFISVYNEYSKAKDVTKRRMYLEALNDLFPKLGQKYIIDSDQKNILPFLNLGKQGGETK